MRRVLSLLLVFLLAMPLLAAGQQPQLPPLGSDRDRDRRPGGTFDEEVARAERENAKKQNKVRQETIKKDTDRLLELATELKEYVDKTNEHVLSLDVLKKAEEIEKLAHTVKTKMKAQ